jgi:hypothetical protein
MLLLLDLTNKKFAHRFDAYDQNQPRRNKIKANSFRIKNTGSWIKMSNQQQQHKLY